MMLFLDMSVKSEANVWMGVISATHRNYQNGMGYWLNHQLKALFMENIYKVPNSVSIGTGGAATQQAPNPVH